VRDRLGGRVGGGSPAPAGPALVAGALMPADFRARVTEAVLRIPAGQVASYGEVAADAGYPGAARGVGAVIAASDGLPWWRVVYADGRLVPGKEGEHGRRLAAEGVAVVGGRVASTAVRVAVVGNGASTAEDVGRKRRPPAEVAHRAPRRPRRRPARLGG